MSNICIKRYQTGIAPDGVPYVGESWECCIEPEDRAWILFIAVDGTAVFYPKRDPQTGAVIT